MAHTPVSQADSSEPCDPSGADASRNSRSEQASAGLTLSKCLSALAASGHQSISVEVALDLVLNDILQRACSATSAGAGAIAMADKGELVCRATTGGNAPDLGIRLDTAHGLSGACVTARKWQRCNDTESDARVNAAVCRHLGVRSILVVPVLSDGELIGVIEIFSVRADAFSDKDVQSLEAFSQEVVHNVKQAREAQASEPPEPIRRTPLADSLKSPIFEPGMSTMESAEVTKEAEPQKEYSTTVLLVCVVLLALVVGWMIGRAEWHSRVKSAAPAAKNQSELAPPDSVPVRTTDQVTTQQLEPSPQQSKLTGVRSDAENGLVVTRDGKVVFRAPAQHGDNLAGSVHQASDEHASTSSELRLPPEVAQQYLVMRVEPEYPEQARKDQIQGTTVLDAHVGKDGTVQKVSPVTGDPELLPAATQSVQQWRFRPYLDHGQPQEFTTRITVVFRLP